MDEGQPRDGELDEAESAPIPHSLISRRRFLMFHKLARNTGATVVRVAGWMVPSIALSYAITHVMILDSLISPTMSLCIKRYGFGGWIASATTFVTCGHMLMSAAAAIPTADNRSNTFDAVRAAGLAVFRPSRLPTGFELQEVIQSSRVTSYLRYSDVANKRNISIAVAPGARLKVLENSWEATTVQGKTAYIIRGNWRTSSSDRAVSLYWESSGQVLLVFEHSDRAVVMPTDSPDHVTVAVLKDIAESFTLEN